jgi:HEPN domain-containing protein
MVYQTLHTDVSFTDEDADTCIKYSKEILDEVRSILNN